MFFSMGNIAAHRRVGILFIDFESPHRLRLHGESTTSADDLPLPGFNGGKLVVRVTVSKRWTNCPRCINRYRKLGQSRYVAREACDTPLAEWKRLGVVQVVPPPKDVGRPAQAGGPITMNESMEKLMKGGA